jgi:EF-P beta-lysylation protein EpmB
MPATNPVFRPGKRMILVDSPPVVRPKTPSEPDWRLELKTAVRDPGVLCRMLGLPPEWEAAARRAARDFPLFAPASFIARMRPGDPRDPLLLQVLPLDAELQSPAGFTADPVGDGPARRAPGLIHKYHGRALMITTGACAVHCRYCFRRHYPYSETSAADSRPHALAELAADPSISEVLLSGGDPLTLRDEQLADLAQRLAAIPHLRRLRIHTRLPIVIPQRSLTGWLRGTRLTPVLVVHANHPQEIDDRVQRHLEELVDAGIPVLNQAVLLRGVNDDLETLVQLSQRLLDCRVLPYYLHQLDRVVGAAHFETPVQKGLDLMAQLRQRLPGYAIPRYVQEIPGDPGKRVLA